MEDSAPSVELTVEEVHRLTTEVLRSNGCDDANAEAVARTLARAERDGAESHGLFRLPGYVASLRSGKVDGCACPELTPLRGAVLRLNGHGGFAPLALERGLGPLARAATDLGIAALAIRNSYHFAALWPEVEALTEAGLAALTCVNYAAVMAPYGGAAALLGTNPIAFAWPRPGQDPLVVDMATSAMARGDIQIAARDGASVPSGTGVDRTGAPTTDPAAILEGLQLPFGGPKGSALALMVEFLSAGITGEAFSIDAATDVDDGGPPRGGQLLIAMAPERFAGDAWAEHAARFFNAFEGIEGARIPGSRRHQRRRAGASCRVDAGLLRDLRSLI